MFGSTSGVHESVDRVLRRKSASNSTTGAMFAGSSTPMQDDQGDLAQLEKVAAGQGEETGLTTLQDVADFSLKMFKVLREKQELERFLATKKMSHMQATISEMAETLRSREDETLDQVKRDLETLRSEVKVRELGERWCGLLQDPRVPRKMPDSLVDTRRLQTNFASYVSSVRDYSNYVHKLQWAGSRKRKIWSDSPDRLLKDFLVPEGAHAAFKREFWSRKKHLVWEHWVSLVMFNGFEHPLFCELSDAQFAAKKYVEVFPRWLFLEIGGRSNEDRSKQFEEDITFRDKFTEIVKYVRVLQSLASAHVPDRVILKRDNPGTAFDETYHSCAMHPDTQSGGGGIIQAVLTPGFLVGTEVINKSRVVCSEHH